MEASMDVNTTNNDGDTRLIIASRFSLFKNEVLSLLSPNSINDSGGTTSLSRAQLKTTSVNINQANNDSQTALMVAAGKGHDDVVEMLIHHKGVEELDVNVRDINNKTALHYAVVSGSSKCVKLLLEVQGIEIDDNIESYIRGKERREIVKMIQDSKARIWKKTKDFENSVSEACAGDLSKLPEPWEPDHVQVKKSMDLIKAMSFTKDYIFCIENGKLVEVKWLEYPEQVVFNTINSLISFSKTDLSNSAKEDDPELNEKMKILRELQEKLASNNPPNLNYFLNISLVDLMKNPGAATPIFSEGLNFNIKEILESMACSEWSDLINGLANMSDMSKYPSDILSQGVKFYLGGLERALGVPWEVSIVEFKLHFSFCKYDKNYQNAYDINETHWEKISSQISSDEDECCQIKFVDRDGSEFKFLNLFVEYIVNKNESLCGMGKMEEAKELCLGTLKDFEDKTFQIKNGKTIKLSPTEVKSDLGLIIERLYVCLSSISVHELDFEKAFKILDRKAIDGLEVRLDAMNSNHKKLKQLLTETSSIAKESLGEDFENAKIIVNSSLENHYIDKNGKIFVETLDKALRIAKNGDTIFLKNGEHDLGQNEENKEKILTRFQKNVTITGESTNKSVLNISCRKPIMAVMEFRKLHVKVSSPIYVTEGKISFDSCLVDVCSEVCFAFDKCEAKIELHLCCITGAVKSGFALLLNPDSTIGMSFRNCSFSDFETVIMEPTDEMSLRCSFDLHIESCSFFGINQSFISLFPLNLKESLKQLPNCPEKEGQPAWNNKVKVLRELQEEMINIVQEIDDLKHRFVSKSVYPGHRAYSTSVVIKNSFVEASKFSFFMSIDNASHVLIESTKFSAKEGDPYGEETERHAYTALSFANIQFVEIVNTVIIREGNYSRLTNLQTYLERKEIKDQDETAIQLMAVHEATIRDSIFKGFYCGINTEILDIVNKGDNICFTGVYNCEFSNMAICVLLDSRRTSRSIFVLSDVAFRDSLMGIKISETCSRNGSVDVLDTKLINVALPILVPKVLKKDAFCVKDKNNNLLSRLKMKNISFPDEEPQNVSRKKRKNDVVANLKKSGVLDPTVLMPYLETIFKSKGNWLEIATEKDLELFNSSRPQSKNDCQSDSNESVD